jgi:hypothetical protein
MVGFLQRLPSFRRSVSSASTNSIGNSDVQRTGETGTDSTATEETWSAARASEYVAQMQTEELRIVLLELAERELVAREAVRKYALRAGTEAQASQSMNKKRRADVDLERSVDNPANVAAAAVDDLAAHNAVASASANPSRAEQKTLQNEPDPIVQQVVTQELLITQKTVIDLTFSGGEETESSDSDTGSSSDTSDSRDSTKSDRENVVPAGNVQ